jgi:hypothetical protein
MARRPIGLNKEARTAYIRREADKMARSGECTDWHLIEFKLRQAGYTEAKRVLHNKLLRDELDSLCKEARKAQGKPPI